MSLYFDFLSLNVGIETGKVKAKEQQEFVEKNNFRTKEEAKRYFYLEKIHDVKPAIVCLQEQIPKDVKEINGKMIEDLSAKLKAKYTPFYESYGSNKQAAVLVKKDFISDNSKLKRVEFTNADTREYSEIRARLVLVEFTPNGFSLPIYIGSWHGPWTGPWGGEKLERQRKYVDAILKRVKTHVGERPFFIAGDFNLKHRDLPQLPHYCYSISAKNDKIDYLIVGRNGTSSYPENLNKVTFKDPKMTVIAEVKQSSYRRSDAESFLGHTPQLANATIIEKQSSSDVASLRTGFSSFWQ
ncbi:uncharacterized protein [Clytia hemisphaerica]|uniref:Endonuclease/exonuclease/phosphatase domain-containing protein n=1 Tax=Clytia hemisphaerica TaxID=252671 RepID=A0A7M5UPZ7_9CNID